MHKGYSFQVQFKPDAAVMPKIISQFPVCPGGLGGNVVQPVNLLMTLPTAGIAHKLHYHMYTQIYQYSGNTYNVH